MRQSSLFAVLCVIQVNVLYEMKFDNYLTDLSGIKIQRKMQVTIDTSTLQQIYDAVTTVYYAKLENKHTTSPRELMQLMTLKTHLSSILDINIIFFKQRELQVDSPFIHRYSKDAKDNLHIEFTLSGLLLIQRCINFRLQVLWTYAKEVKHDVALFNAVNESITETEEVLRSVEDFLVPLSN